MNFGLVLNTHCIPDIGRNFCLQVPEQDNGSPVFRFTLEMLKVEFDGEGMLPKERSSQVLSNQKKSSKKKMTKKEAIVLQTSVWNPVYDGSGLRYTFVLFYFGSTFALRPAFIALSYLCVDLYFTW